MLAPLQRRLAERDQRRGVERFLDLVLLADLAGPEGGLGDLGLEEDAAQIDAVGLPVVHSTPHLDALGVSDHLVKGPETEVGHVLTNFHGHEVHEVDDALRVAVEALAKLRVLRRHADGAGVLVADAHHHAAQSDQRRGREAEFLGPQEGPDDDIASRLHLAVDFDRHSGAQVVQEQGLVGFGDAEFPRQAGMLDRRQRRRAGAAVVAADQDHVGVGLGDAGRDCAHTDFRHQLDRDSGVLVGVLEVVDQLGQILD